MDSATNEVIHRSWDINSITVYGALVFFLLLAVVMLWRELKANTKTTTELLTSNIQVITTFTSKFDGDGQVLRDKQLEASMRGVVQQELVEVVKGLEALKK